MRASVAPLRLMAIAIWLCSMVISSPFQACFSSGKIVDDLIGPDGGTPVEQVNVTFVKKGSSTLHTTVPYPSLPLSAGLRITGGPAPGCGTYPQSPKIDIGGDGVVDWEFDGIGYGAMGHQTLLTDGKESFSLTVDGHVTKEPGIFLPSGSRIIGANVTLGTAPTPRENATQDYGIVRLLASETVDRTLDVPDDDIEGVSSHVFLRDLAKEVKKADYCVVSGTENMTTLNVNYLVAQSFLPQVFNDASWRTYLTSIDLMVVSAVGFRGDIKISISNTTGAPDYKPAGDYFGWGNLSANNWEASEGTPQPIKLDRPVPLEAGKVISVVVTSPTSSGGANQGYLVSLYGPVSGDNSASPVTTTGTWAHTAQLFGSWSPWRSKDMGMTSYNLIREPINIMEINNNISMNGVANGTFENNNLLFTEEPSIYTDGGWLFNVSNWISNPISFKMTANTTYERWPRNVKLDIGTDGLIEWCGPALHGNSSIDITAALSDALANVAVPILESYGIRMARVGLGLSADNMGTVNLTAINISYDYTATMPDFRTMLGSYMKGHDGGSGNVSVPLIISVDSAGLLRLSGLNISLDMPPQTVERTRTFSIPEEGSNGTLIDLHEHFLDEGIGGTTFELTKGTNLTAGPLRQSKVEIVAERWVNVDMSYMTNITGSFDFTVIGTDAMGQDGEAVVFNVDIAPANDPPMITSVPPKFAEAREPYGYDVVVVDSDDDDASVIVSIVNGPHGMTCKGRTLNWLPVDSNVGTADVTLKASDGDLNTTQSFSIMIEPSGAPSIKHIDDKRVVLGEEMMLRVTATSLDGYPLYFKLDDAPNDMTIDVSTGILTWTPRKLGDFAVVVNVTDLERWTLEGFTITVVPPGTNGTGGGGGDHNDTNSTGPFEGTPGIKVTYPTKAGETISGMVRVTGEAWVENDTLLVVRGQLDDGTPENATGLGDWVYLIDTKELAEGPHSLKVTVFSGSGRSNSTELTFVVKNDAEGQARSRIPGLPASVLGIDTVWFLAIIFLLLAVAAVIAYSKSSRPPKARGKNGGKRAARASKKGDMDMKTGRPVEDIPGPDHRGEKNVGEHVKGTVSKASVPSSAPLTAGKTAGGVLGAFLIYHDGRLLTYHMSKDVKGLDDVLKSAKEEVKNQFQGGRDGRVGGTGTLPSAIPGREDVDILVERGIQMYTVILVEKGLSEERLAPLRTSARSYMHEVHEKYRKSLKNWNGDYEGVGDIEAMTKRFVKDLK